MKFVEKKEKEMLEKLSRVSMLLDIVSVVLLAFIAMESCVWALGISERRDFLTGSLASVGGELFAAGAIIFVAGVIIFNVNNLVYDKIVDIELDKVAEAEKIEQLLQKKSVQGIARLRKDGTVMAIDKNGKTIKFDTLVECVQKL